MKANKSGCLELSLSVHVLLSGFGNEVGAASCDLVSGSVSPRTSRRPGVNLGPDVTLVVDGESNAIPYGDLKRVQGVVADMIRDYFDQDVKGSAPEIKTVGQSSLDRCMRTLEQRLVTVGSNPGMTFGTSGKRPCCSWQWAGVAGELYERLDRDRMVALLKQCALLVSRPTGMTDQWYLAKILQRCLDSRRIKRLMKNVGVECDEGFECTMLLPDMIMADHFVRFPATNEAGRRVIFSISHVAYWLLRTKGKVGRFRKVLGSGTAGEYHWGRIDDFSIKLTRFLWDLWGAERFGRISQLAKQLLPVEVGASMPETCFFWCFVGAIARTNTPEYQTFCSQIGFVPEGKNRVWVLEDQHKDFVERITRLEKEAGGPPEAITTEELQAPQGVDANVEEAQKYVAEMIQDFCKVEGPSTAPLSTLAEPSLSQIMTIVENILSHGQNITTPSHHGTWRWARVAGALYNRLDRSRILELLDSCQTHFGGREEMTDQWYLTKLLQAFAGRRRAASSSLVDRIMNPDERTFAGMILPDIVMARHFVGLPATTTESDRLTIWTVIHVVSWMIKARSNKISGKQTRYMNAGIDDNSIELAAVLFNLWGPERLQQVNRLVEKLLLWKLPKNMSGPCFLACVLQAIRGSGSKVVGHLRHHLGLDSGMQSDTKSRKRKVQDEGDAFFGRLPDTNRPHPTRTSPCSTKTPAGTPTRQLNPSTHQTCPSTPRLPVTNSDSHPRNELVPQLEPQPKTTIDPISWIPSTPLVTPFMANRSVFTLSEISHEAASRSAMHYAAALRDWCSQEVEKTLSASYADLGLRKRHGVEDAECPGGKRGRGGL